MANPAQGMNHWDPHTELATSADMMQKPSPVICPVQGLLQTIKVGRKPSAHRNRGTANSRKIKNMLRQCKFV